MRSVVLGIAGGTGSGKTTVARSIIDRIGQTRVAYLEHDSYYRDLSHMTGRERSQVNFDHPDAFDTPLMIEHIKRLLDGVSVQKPVYSYTESVRTEMTERVDPRPLIVIEGILALENPALRALMDVKIFVDTDDDIRLMRRLRRDTVARGRSMDHVLAQYESTVRPMHLAFVMPSRRQADVVIPRGGHNRVAITMVADALVRRLSSSDGG
ncbi:MAG: uridine kinase [Bradymonadia bacterium]|jgi:uridine kinase